MHIYQLHPRNDKLSICIKCDTSKTYAEYMGIECIASFLFLPYLIIEGGYRWSLIGVKNDFSKIGTDSFVYAEYENQYGHIKQFNKDKIQKITSDDEPII